MNSKKIQKKHEMRKEIQNVRIFKKKSMKDS